MAAVAETLEDRVAADAYLTWQRFRDTASKRGIPAMAHSRYGSGWVVIGSASMAIRRVIRVVKGQRDTHVDLVRKYLRTSNNVVSLDRVADYEFNIFVAEEWRDHASFPVQFLSTGGRRIHRLSGRELDVIAAAEANPEPVIIRHVDDETPHPEETPVSAPALKPVPTEPTEKKKPAQPMSEGSAVVLLTLFYSCGGTCAPDDTSVSAATDLQDRAADSHKDVHITYSSIVSLRDRGYITMAMRDPKHTKSIRITNEGKAAATNINAYRGTAPVLLELVESHGTVNGSTRAMASMLGEPHTSGRIAAAAGKLEAEGKIEVIKTSPKGPIVRLKWVGDDEGLNASLAEYASAPAPTAPPVARPVARPASAAPSAPPTPSGSLPTPDEAARLLRDLAAAYAVISAKADAAADVSASEARIGDLMATLEMIREAVQRQTEGKASVFETLVLIDMALTEAGVPLTETRER